MSKKQKYRLKATLEHMEFDKVEGNRWPMYKAKMKEYEGEFTLLVPPQIHSSGFEFKPGMEVGLISTRDTSESNLEFTVSPHSQCITGKEYDTGAPLFDSKAGSGSTSTQPALSEQGTQALNGDTGGSGNTFIDVNKYNQNTRDPKIAMQTIFKAVSDLYQWCGDNDKNFDTELLNVLNATSEADKFMKTYIIEYYN